MIGSVIWTPERIEQLRALAASGITTSAAAEKLGSTMNAVMGAAVRNKISFRGNAWHSDKIARLRELAGAGLRRREAAEAMGLTFGAVEKAAKRYQIRFMGRADTKNRIKQKWVTYRKPAVEPLGDRSDEIARFIAERGVTRCPPAYAAPSVQGARA